MYSIRDRKKISISKAFHDKYNSLKHSSGNEHTDTPFKDLREIFLLSAAIGVSQNSYEELNNSKEAIFDSNVFTEHNDIPLLYTIAFNKSKDAESLSDDEYVIKIVEGYANGGFPLLLNAIEDTNSNNLLNLVTYLSENLS